MAYRVCVCVCVCVCVSLIASQVCQVNTLLTLLNGYIKAFKDAGKAIDEVRMERIFLFCVTWALGGLLDVKERPLLDHELRSFAANMPPRDEETDTIYEYLVSENGTCVPTIAVQCIHAMH